jgi:5-formyltetrahydrofolate cyclo-ligase
LLLWFESNDSYRHSRVALFLHIFVTTKSQLRSSLQQQRRALSGAARTRAALDVAHLVAGTHWLAPGKRIGLYASMPHELGTAPLLALARARGCAVYLPRVVSLRDRRMEFVPVEDHEGGRDRLHALGMYEPLSTDFFPARFLDTIFVPSVGLDERGARLGHGAGFYDRALAFRRTRRHWRGPRLVGLAYSFQVVTHIPVEATDVFMDVLVTDKGIYESLADEDRTVDVRHR